MNQLLHSQTAIRVEWAEPQPFSEKDLESFPPSELLIVCGAEWAWSAFGLDREMVVVERCAGKVRTLLDLHPELAQVEIYLYEDEATLRGILEGYVDRKCAFVGEADEAREAFYWLEATWREHLDFGEVFYTHFFRNLRQELFDWRHLRFEGIPATICGAGPSLDRFEPVDGLIFAAGSALPALTSRGIIPHFGVGVDPNPSQFARMMTHSGFEVPLLFRPRMHWQAVAAHHGPHLYVGGSGGYPVARWCEEQLGIAGPELEEGYNCVHLAVELARVMGCNPIILAGVDLAFTDGRTYASGVDGHYPDDVVDGVDLFGRPVQTLRKWRAESRWMSRYAKDHPEIAFYNATGAGLGFAGIPSAMPRMRAEVPEVELRPLEVRDVDVVGQLRQSLARCSHLEEGTLGWFELEEEVAYNLMVAPLLEAREKCWRGVEDPPRWEYVQQAVEKLSAIL